MKIEPVKIPISDSIGSVSGEFVIPEKMDALLVLAHGAGADMHHKFMKSLAKGLAETGIGTLRYNFPFMENKKGRPDVPAVAEKTIESAIALAHEAFPKVSLFAGGKSFGGRMTSNLLSKRQIDVKGIVFYGFPLHAPGKPSTDRAAHLKDVKVPMLFLQGTRDTLASLELIEKVTSSLPRATLEIFEGADHSFAAGKKDVMSDLVARSRAWIK
ncbi:MAG TPA: alpha/beta family hydrolase [Chryseosolibacter sp.]